MNLLVVVLFVNFVDIRCGDGAIFACDILFPSLYVLSLIFVFRWVCAVKVFFELRNQPWVECIKSKFKRIKFD